VDVTAAGDVLFSDNHCELRANQTTAAVQVATPVAVVMGNRVVGGEWSMNIPMSKIVTAIGNITTGAIQANIPPQMAALNLQG
jgi:hypothetical protein